MRSNYFLFLCAAVPAIMCMPVQAATKVHPKGHDNRSVWAGSYTFKFKVDPDSPATKVFFYGVDLPDGSVSYNCYEVNRREMALQVSCYSFYRHRNEKTSLDNVLATGSSTFTGRRIVLLQGKDGKPFQMDYNTVYTVKVTAKDRMHTVGLFKGDKKVADVTYDASMLYKGDVPKKINTLLNRPFAPKPSADYPLLREHPRKLKEFEALKRERQQETDKPEPPAAKDTPAPKPAAPAPANINAKDAAGNTALMRAVLRKDYDQVRKLVSQGASAKTANNQGMSPFKYALENSDARLMQIFVTENLKREAGSPR